MSYSAEALVRKLNALQDTQDSIVSVSQWVLFHHRHSKESAVAWAEYLTGDPHLSSKKLTLLYLCNEVIQQARHKRKTEFLDAYFAVLPSALNEIYKQLDTTTQSKVDRLLNVWNQRNIFSDKQIADMKRAVELSRASKSLVEGAEEERQRQEALAVVVAPELKFVNDLLISITRLQESNQANLSQVGIQSKNYLPEDPSGSDNLPSPKIYISKLNVLEKLCNVSIKTLREIETQRKEVVSHLTTLQTLLVDGATADAQKLAVIESKKQKLVETRAELQELLQEETETETEANPESQPEQKATCRVDKSEEEVSPTFESVGDKNTGANNSISNDDDDDDDDIPQYENDDNDSDDSDDEDNEPQTKKQKLSPAPLTETSSKVVAFSDDVEVREYVKEDGGDGIRIVKSDSEASDDFEDEPDDDSEDDKFLGLSEDEDLIKFEKRHKDAVDLKHDHEHEQPVQFDNGDGGTNGLASSVLDLLSKLA